MGDWLIAIILAFILVAGVLVLPPLMALIGVMLFPVLLLVAAVVAIWFVIKIFRDATFDEDT